VQFVRDGKTITEDQGEMIQQCINNSDLSLLEKINQEFQL